MPVGVACRGKSELHRAGCQVTPGRREATERATENRPPLIPRVRVKRWGKSPPRAWQQAWHGNPQSEQGQISSETRAGSRCLFGLAPTGGYRATPVARRAVGSYPTVSPLPLDKGRSVFCGPFRRLTAPRCYLAVCPRELGLSSACHSNRHTATITPYRHPAGKLPVLEGSGQV